MLSEGKSIDDFLHYPFGDYYITSRSMLYFIGDKLLIGALIALALSFMSIKQIKHVKIPVMISSIICFGIVVLRIVLDVVFIMKLESYDILSMRYDEIIAILDYELIFETLQLVKETSTIVAIAILLTPAGIFIKKIPLKEKFKQRIMITPLIMVGVIVIWFILRICSHHTHNYNTFIAVNYSANALEFIYMITGMSFGLELIFVTSRMKSNNQ